MAFVNLASLTKLHRANQIIADIGTNGLMLLYTGTVPASPDFTVTDTLLATLPLSSTAGVSSLVVQSAAITNAGTLGTDGTYSMTITGGGGSGAAGYFVVAGNSITQTVISDPGFGYTSAPTISGFTAAGLSGASLSPVMTALISFNAISSATAVATGNAGYARVATSASTPIIDLDVGTTNASSVMMNTTFITDGGAVTCSAEVIIEA